MSYKIERYVSPAFATSATTVITPPYMDVSNFDKFTIHVMNSATNNAIVHTLIETSLDASQTDSWVPLNTASYPYPSAIASTAAGQTVAINSAYKFVRVSCRPTVSASAGLVTVRVGGFVRNK